MNSEDLKKLHELEQGSELFSNAIPHLLHLFYVNLVREGFVPSEALKLTRTYLVTLFGNRQ